MELAWPIAVGAAALIIIKMEDLEIKQLKNSITLCPVKNNGIEHTVMLTAYDSNDQTLVNYWINKKDAQKIIKHLKRSFKI